MKSRVSKYNNLLVAAMICFIKYTIGAIVLLLAVLAALVSYLICLPFITYHFIKQQ